MAFSQFELTRNLFRFARDLQGSDLPICYGFYRFCLPTSQEEVIGVVLEDLVSGERGIALDTFLLREAKANRLTSEHFRAIVSAFAYCFLVQIRTDANLQLRQTKLSISNIDFTIAVWL